MFEVDSRGRGGRAGTVLLLDLLITSQLSTHGPH